MKLSHDGDICTGVTLLTCPHILFDKCGVIPRPCLTFLYKVYFYEEDFFDPA